MNTLVSTYLGDNNRLWARCTATVPGKGYKVVGKLLPTLTQAKSLFQYLTWYKVKFQVLLEDREVSIFTFATQDYPFVVRW